uniref:Uncharacterized protein n=1 Tax=Vespula pensylvanica TaxID=30213 RepID=A0A834JYT5_VESPE|nr:hypothetical protein H0235_016731 [Vespula pensylvanica]
MSHERYIGPSLDDVPPCGSPWAHAFTGHDEIILPDTFRRLTFFQALHRKQWILPERMPVLARNHRSQHPTDVLFHNSCYQDKGSHMRLFMHFERTILTPTTNKRYPAQSKSRHPSFDKHYAPSFFQRPPIQLTMYNEIQNLQQFSMRSFNVVAFSHSFAGTEQLIFWREPPSLVPSPLFTAISRSIALTIKKRQGSKSPEE